MAAHRMLMSDANAVARTAATTLASDGTWQPVDTSTPQGRARIVEDAAALTAQPRFSAMYQDVAWHFGDGDWSRSLVMLRGGPSGIDGYAPFFVQDRPLRVLVGEVTIASFALRRYTFFAEPLLAGADEAASTRALVDLLRGMRARLEPGEALFFEGIATDSLGYRVLTHPDVVREFIVLPTCTPYDHQFVQMPPDYEAYLQTLGARSRNSLRKSERKLDQVMEGRVRAECFESPDTVERFLQDAEAISRTTYQWNLLGLGLRVDDELRRKVSYAAQRGWLRSYILYCKDVPAAFIYGYLHDDCYYISDGGYNPEYADLSVGSMSILKIFQDLYARGPVPRRFDFATGFGAHKARWSNASRNEAEVLLLPKTLGNRVRALVFSVGSSVVARVIAAIDRFGVKAALKKAIRRLSTR